MVQLTLLLLLLFAGVTVSSVVDLQKRIIHGGDCGPGERHYHVKLRIYAHIRQQLCGGSLISDRWILTAAHCWIQNGTMYAYLGQHTGRRQPPVQIIQGTIFNDGLIHHDIMLLKLPNPTQIHPVRLPPCNNRFQGSQPRPGQTVQMAGYGSTQHDANNQRPGGESQTLQCVDINVVNCPAFNTLRIGHEPYMLDQVVFCGQNPPHQGDSCIGDSGGGVIFNNMIYGVISSGGISACTEPVKFMNVCYPDYYQWIQNTIRTP
ncbi:anionic trypsin-like [Thalassophryne amazonica]|uniref:anionic trypsin-like n=1 Tax=Thalassophryne amazonica TaxID=390379 RepID=UPI00147149E0|nr:anionic trypsin-like [Thalassophryne amazonica]